MCYIGIRCIVSSQHVSTSLSVDWPATSTSADNSEVGVRPNSSVTNKKVLPMKHLLAISMFAFTSVAFAEDAKNLLKPLNKVESWRFEQHDGAVGSFKISDDAAVFDATKLTGMDWHVQAFQTDLDLKEGQQYTLKLKLSGSQRRGVILVATTDMGDYHEIGLREDLTVNKEPRTFEFTFRATGVAAKKNRIGFMLGEEKGDLIVKEMSLTEKADKK